MAESANAAFVRRAYELVNAGELETPLEGFEAGFEWMTSPPPSLTSAPRSMS